MRTSVLLLVFLAGPGSVVLAQRDYPRPKISLKGKAIDTEGFYSVAQTYPRLPRGRGEVARLVVETALRADEDTRVVLLADSLGTEWRVAGSPAAGERLSMADIMAQARGPDILEVLPGSYRVTVRNTKDSKGTRDRVHLWNAEPGRTYAVFSRNVQEWEEAEANAVRTGRESRTFLPAWNPSPHASRHVEVRVSRTFDGGDSTAQRNMQVGVTTWFTLRQEYHQKEYVDRLLGEPAACESVGDGQRCSYHGVVYRTEVEGQGGRQTQGRQLTLDFDRAMFLVRIADP